jgi:hypothetical protein
MLTNGWLRAGFERVQPRYPAVPLPPDLAGPATFVPQKVKALRRAKLIAASAATATILALLKWLM